MTGTLFGGACEQTTGAGASSSAGRTPEDEEIEELEKKLGLDKLSTKRKCAVLKVGDHMDDILDLLDDLEEGKVPEVRIFLFFAFHPPLFLFCSVWLSVLLLSWHQACLVFLPHPRFVQCA